MSRPRLELEIRRTTSAVAVALIIAQAVVATVADVRATQAEVARTREDHVDRHRERVREEVERAAGYLHHTLPEEPSRAEIESALDYLQTVRFGADDRLFMIAWEPDRRTVLLGAFERWHVMDPDNARFNELHGNIKRTADAGGGFLEYEFHDELGDKLQTKISYIAPTLPWNWTLGGGAYLPDIEPEIAPLEAALHRRLWLRLGGSLAFLLLAMAALYLVNLRAFARLRHALVRFDMFFEQAAEGSAIIDLDAVEYAELVTAASAANTMIERRQRALAHQRQAHKLEAVGQLASGVAHDFNNILAGIMGNADMLALHEDPQVRADADAIVAASERARELTRGLLGFARRDAKHSEPFCAHAVIVQATKLLRRSIDSAITVELELDEDGARSVVEGDSTELFNALLNLGINARDAIAERGHITYSSALVSDREGAPRLCIEVRDDGVGMTEDVRERALEPFFTTKPAGQGTGLGLAGVASCVRNMGGRVELESTPGEGSTVRMLLPLSANEPVTKAGAHEVAPARD